MVGVVLLAVGVELFSRRDLGVTANVSLPSLPDQVLGVQGPIARAFGEQLPRALAWGLGMGLMGALMASLVGSFAKQIGGDTSLVTTFATIFPGYDFATAGGWLQLYVALFYIAAGLAARDVRLEVGVGRDRRPARGDPRQPALAGPLGDLRGDRRDRCSRR